MTPFTARRRAEEFDALVAGLLGRVRRRRRERTPTCSRSWPSCGRRRPRPARPEFIASLRERLMAEAETVLVAAAGPGPAEEARPACRAAPARDRRLAALLGGPPSSAPPRDGRRRPDRAAGRLPLPRQARHRGRPHRPRREDADGPRRCSPAPRGRLDEVDQLAAPPRPAGRGRRHARRPSTRRRPRRRTCCSRVPGDRRRRRRSARCATSPPRAWTGSARWQARLPEPPATSCWPRAASSPRSTPPATACPSLRRRRATRAARCSPRPPRPASRAARPSTRLDADAPAARGRAALRPGRRRHRGPRAAPPPGRRRPARSRRRAAPPPAPRPPPAATGVPDRRRPGDRTVRPCHLDRDGHGRRRHQAASPGDVPTRVNEVPVVGRSSAPVVRRLVGGVGDTLDQTTGTLRTTAPHRRPR